MNKLNDFKDWVADMPTYQKILVALGAVALLLFVWRPFGKNEGDDEEKEDSIDNGYYAVGGWGGGAGGYGSVPTQVLTPPPDDDGLTSPDDDAAIITPPDDDPVTPAPTPAPAPAVEWKTHTVRRGQTLSGIMGKLGLNWRTLWSKGWIENRSGKAGLIYTGETIRYRTS